MTVDEREKQRQLEIERGAFVLALKAMDREFNPDYVPQEKADEGPNSHISAAERARRDEYRKNSVVNWSKLDRA